MNLSLDALVLLLTHEGATNFACLSDFCNKSIENLSSVCKSIIPSIEEDATNRITVEDSVSRSNISSMSVSMIITAVNVAKYYGFIARIRNAQNMGHTSVLEHFKI